MPMLKRGYGAVRNLRGKSGARFLPSTVILVGNMASTNTSIITNKIMKISLVLLRTSIIATSITSMISSLDFQLELLSLLLLLVQFS